MWTAGRLPACVLTAVLIAAAAAAQVRADGAITLRLMTPTPNTWDLGVLVSV